MADATAPTALAVFTVTPEAIARILELRDQEENPDALALRVEVTGTNGVEYAYDLAFDALADADAADAVYHQGDLPVIAPVGSIEQLTGATLDVPERVEQLLREQINPALAAHGGFAELKGVEGEKVYVTMGGGCQGCAVSAMTLRDGIARSIKEAIPEVTDVIDTTDHDAGENPFYT